MMNYCSYVHKQYLLLLFISLFSFSTNAQPTKRTSQWYFADYIGIDFTSGTPVQGTPSPLYSNGNSTSTMCDTSGNLLFYSDGVYVYNRNHEPMENSYGGCVYCFGTQAALAMPVPGSDSLYYVFTIGNVYPANNQGLNFYHTIDMSVNGGLGGVIDTDTLPQVAFDAAGQLQASYFRDKSGYWIISRKYREHKYIAFKVTEEGVDPIPVLSDAPNRYFVSMSWNTGHMKMALNKKYLAFIYNKNVPTKSDTEICRFNNETGEIEFLYSFQLRYVLNDSHLKQFNGEFSPDSKYFYLASITTDGTVPQNMSKIHQFDMQYIENEDLFTGSCVKIGEPVGYNMQLGPDGKIYCMANVYYDPAVNNVVAVINNPGKPGNACGYQQNILDIDSGLMGSEFVNFCIDFLHRFDFDGICESETFTFTPWFFPEPVSFQWNFNDPLSGGNNNSTLSNPTHNFTGAGTYEVTVVVEYPDGRIEETSREVEVDPAPDPNLGPDMSICFGDSVYLDAECGPYSYLWSTGNFSSSHITVSDTGWYWVEVLSQWGCFGHDSIYISQYPTTTIDTSQLVISPTTCGGSTGAIRGAELIGAPPFSYIWVNEVGDTMATTQDILHLPVGNYTLLTTDGNGCSNIIGPFSIVDAGEVLIENVSFGNEHCGQNDAFIEVEAISGLGDMLFYSIDNGTTWQYNQGVYNNIMPGVYAVRVKDSTLCQDVYDENPISIIDEQGPQITNVQVIPETSGMGDGMINITAISSGDTIYYSIDNGVTSQLNNGVFSNLVTGYYSCVVSDEFGCDTAFIVEVQENFTTILEAIAGDIGICQGDIASIPLIVTNFNEVAEFKSTLMFNKDLVTITGYTNTSTLIEDSLLVMLYPVEGKIELLWSSNPPVTLPPNTDLLDLIFTAGSMIGGSLIEWDSTTGANEFFTSSGTSIPVTYYGGQVLVYKELHFSIPYQKNVCFGDSLYLFPMLWSANGPVTYNWTLPSGETAQVMDLMIGNLSFNQEGLYTLYAIDTAGCNSTELTEVFVNQIPSPEFAIEDTIYTQDPIDLDAGYGFLHYWWNTGDTTQTIWVENDGWYMAEVESQQGCIGSDSSYVVFSSPSPPELITMYFPNAFTPNSDGLNDVFKPVTSTIDIQHFSLSVYNRWGALIYQTNDISQGWDGTYQGKFCMPGAYVYKIAYSNSSSSNIASEVKMGSVMLVR